MSQAGTPTPSYSGHGAGSVSPATLARYAPPKLSAAETRDIERRMDIVAPFSGGISNDGRNLCVNWVITGTSQVWCFKAPLGLPQQLTAGNDTTMVASWTFPDWRIQLRMFTADDRIVVSRDQNGEENPGLYLVSIHGGPLQEIFHKKGVQAYSQGISPDGTALYFKANDRRPDSHTIYRYDLKTREISVVFDQPGLWQIADMKDGIFLLEKSTGGSWREYYEYNPATQSLIPLLGQGEHEEHSMSFARNPGEFIVHTNQPSNYKRIYRWNKEGGLQPITPDQEFDVTSYSIDPTRSRLLYQVHERGHLRVYGIDLRTYRELQVPKFPEGRIDHVFPLGNSTNGRFGVFSVEVPYGPLSIYVYDWQKKKLVNWSSPSTPEVDTSLYAPAELDMDCISHDGVRIPLLIRRPKGCGDKLCPVVVDFHGGPESTSFPGFNTYAQMFVDAGFVYVAPNVRGSAAFGKEWLNADNGAKRLNVITDIRDVGLYLRKKFAVKGVEPKVGVMGASYGGYSTLIAVTMFAGTYDAAVAEVGMSNLVSFLENTGAFRRQLRISEYGDPVRDRDVLLQLSPITYIHQLKEPLLLIQGATDPRVPVGEALQMYEAVQSRGVESKLVIFPDEGHGIWNKRANQVIDWWLTRDWFEKHLK